MAGSWSTGGNVNKPAGYVSGCGEQNSALKFGGYDVTNLNNTEEYNGSSWCTAGNLNMARHGLAGCGTQLAGLSFGGRTTTRTNRTEEYNGTSWCTAGNLITAREHLAGCGTQIAGIAFGGYTTTYSNVVEGYNGTVWSTKASMVVARSTLGGCGSATAVVGAGGSNKNYVESIIDPTNIVEKFNGIAWSRVSDLLISRAYPSLFGTQTLAVVAGGLGSNGITEGYNGTSWFVDGLANQIVSRYGSAGCGTQAAGLCISGRTPVNHVASGVCEEYIDVEVTKSWSTNGQFAEGVCSFVSFARVADELRLAGTWISSSDMNLGRSGLGGCGVQNAALSFGGFRYGITAVSDTENYNGSVWSNIGNLNIDKSVRGCGTQVAALAVGGYRWYEFDVDYLSQTEEFDGVRWLFKGNMNEASLDQAVIGTVTAALSFGGEGYNKDRVNTEEYDGTSWSKKSNLNIGRTLLAGAGTILAGLSFGGKTQVLGAKSSVETYNGTTWSIGNSLNVARYGLGGAGVQTSALSFGGYDGDYKGVTEEFNGTIWCNVNSVLIKSRKRLAGCGTQGQTLSFGGDDGNVNQYLKTCEEYRTSAIGTWTIDLDSLGIRKWKNLSWTKVGGGSIKVRVKSADSQANLAGATLYPISSYYTTQPVDVECPDNRFYRLEITLESDVTYGEPLFICGRCLICSDMIKLDKEDHNGALSEYGVSNCKYVLINKLLSSNSNLSPELKDINQIYD